MNNKTALRMRKLICLLACALMLSAVGCSEEKSAEEKSQTTAAEDTVIVGSGATAADLFCLEINTFSGVFVEDGKNEEVENVASILVENRSAAFLDKATITYKYGDTDAVFLLTGLPAGEKCWVIEQNKLEVDGKYSFEFEDCVTAFKEDAMLASDEIKIDSEDNVITITNVSDEKLLNVCAYYKNTMDDGNYFGGITYMINFGDIEPGDSVTKESAHYSNTSKVVRYSYQ